jgi:hypothetical protein
VADPEKALEWGLVEAIEELNPKGEEQPNASVWTVTW